MVIERVIDIRFNGLIRTIGSYCIIPINGMDRDIQFVGLFRPIGHSSQNIYLNESLGIIGIFFQDSWSNFNYYKNNAKSGLN